MDRQLKRESSSIDPLPLPDPPFAIAPRNRNHLHLQSGFVLQTIDSLRRDKQSLCTGSMLRAVSGEIMRRT